VTQLLHRSVYDSLSTARTTRPNGRGLVITRDIEKLLKNPALGIVKGNAAKRLQVAGLSWVPTGVYSRSGMDMPPAQIQITAARVTARVERVRRPTNTTRGIAKKGCNAGVCA